MPPLDPRREDLLDALVDLFLAEGFLHLGVGDLAARLRCSRTTLYRVAPTKEQIVVTVVRAYFRRATEQVETALETEAGSADRLACYLSTVADALAPASPAFHTDLAAFAPAAEIYQQNTQHAARRVEQLVDDGVRRGDLRAVDAAFAGAVVARAMAGIQDGAISAATGRDAAAAYRALADLVLHGLALE